MHPSLPQQSCTEHSHWSIYLLLVIQLLSILLFYIMSTRSSFRNTILYSVLRLLSLSVLVFTTFVIYAASQWFNRLPFTELKYPFDQFIFMATFSINILTLKLKYKKYVNIVIYVMFMLVVQVEILEYLGNITNNLNKNNFGVGLEIAVYSVTQFFGCFALCQAIFQQLGQSQRNQGYGQTDQNQKQVQTKNYQLCQINIKCSPLIISTILSALSVLSLIVYILYLSYYQIFSKQQISPVTTQMNTITSSLQQTRSHVRHYYYSHMQQQLLLNNNNNLCLTFQKSQILNIVMHGIILGLTASIAASLYCKILDQFVDHHHHTQQQQQQIINEPFLTQNHHKQQQNAINLHQYRYKSRKGVRYLIVLAGLIIVCCRWAVDNFIR